MQVQTQVHTPNPKNYYINSKLHLKWTSNVQIIAAYHISQSNKEIHNN